MKLFKIAERMALKYHLESLGVGAPSPHVFEQVKKDIRNVYNLYVNPQTAKEPAIQMAANNGEPYSKQLTSQLKKFISQLDTMSPTRVLNALIKVTRHLYDMGVTHLHTLRSSIHDSVYISKVDRDTGYREHLKSKYMLMISPLSSILVNSARTLAKSMESPLMNQIPPKVPRPSPKVLNQWERYYGMLKHPKAQAAGLTSRDMIEKVVTFNNGAGAKVLDNFIRSDSDPEKLYAVKQITDYIKQKMPPKTNAPEFEQDENAPPHPESLFNFEEDEPEHFIEGDPNIVEPYLMDPSEINRKQEQMKKEDEEKKQRQQEWESKMESKYSNQSLQNFLRKASK